MKTKEHFHAPVSVALRLVSGIVVVLMLSLMGFGFSVPNVPVWTRFIMVLLPPLFILGGMLFMVRGYTVEPGLLLVQRWLWRTPIDLRGLRAVEVDPDAFRRTIRLCGNGGFFSFTGWFWNSRLRRFRAFATDPRQSVILTFDDRRVVVTPEQPDTFARLLKEN